MFQSKPGKDRNTVSKNVSKGVEMVLGPGSGGVVLDSSAKSSIINAETTPEATDSDPYVEFHIRVVMLTSKLCCTNEGLWVCFLDDMASLKFSQALKIPGD